ncbi:MAG: RecQ family ATP-dependent DNA helicase [Bdellovibrionota bacterium]
MDFVTHCEQIAKQHFAIDGLRPAQKEVFTLIEQKKYVLATLPTGSGKTLLYAVPSLIYEQGVVLVISPLISLMRDQSRRMNDAKIPCVIFTSEQTEEERKHARNMIKNNEAKIIFASPERFVLPSFLNLISKLNMTMAVVDGAHCVVSWGHQFRPEYSEIGKYLSKLNPPRILAITATASRNSRLDIIKKVFPAHIDVAEFTSKPLSPHIHVQSIRQFSQVDLWQKLIDILLNTNSKKTIVYFQTRKLCDEFALKLRKLKIVAIVYHAGLSKYDRSTSEQYIHTATQKIVICATTAFGMGVDISGVQLVVVYGFPSNIEEFFQMLGRAGRAGENSQGILLWAGSDPIKRQYQFKSSFPIPSLLIDVAANAISLMSKNQSESVLVEKEKLLNALSKSAKIDHNKKLDGILSGLRICGVLEEPSFFNSFFQIKLSPGVTLTKLLTSLPDSTTKRKKVLEALKELTEPKWRTLEQAQVAVSISLLVETSELSEQVVEQVFAHYAEQNMLQLVKITPSQNQPYVILKHDFLYLQKELSKYITARNNFSASLQELEKLSTATTCRLLSSFDFFSSRALQGGAKKSYFCMQCDLCTKQEKRNA